MKPSTCPLPGKAIANPLNRFTVCTLLCALAVPGFAQQAIVDITPGHSTNSFSPLRAPGAGIGNVLVTVYSALRPDGQWSLLLVNKDQFAPHALTVDFHNSNDNTDHFFQGNIVQISFGADNYAWHPHGQNGTANPDGPAVTSSQPGGKGVQYTLPKASVTVLRGTVE